jgi:hypothetical protein
MEGLGQEYEPTGRAKRDSFKRTKHLRSTKHKARNVAKRKPRLLGRFSRQSAKHPYAKMTCTLLRGGDNPDFTPYKLHHQIAKIV